MGCAQAGFATIFNFWCFPDQTRIRVSQVLVPPPNQGKGIGRALLDAVYTTADERGAVDVTVTPLPFCPCHSVQPNCGHMICPF